jgi:outer membrane protein OmpA-like peptidoglycan-associated protein
MKNIIFLITVVFISIITVAQTTPTDNQYGFQISARVGYDFPTYTNNTPYIDYKGGMDLGISTDYYWSWFGLGGDFDYIKNNPENIYPTINLYDPGFTLITDFILSEKGINRTFLGLGPSFKYETKDNKFSVELNTRAGISSIKGGRTELRILENNYLLNFHAGYDAKNIFSAKGQLRFTYFFAKKKDFGVHLGAYYLRHFNVQELNERGVVAYYHPFSKQSGGTNETVDLMNLSDPIVRGESCDCDIYSIGIFAGLTYRFKTKEKTISGNYALAVTAKDLNTGITLPETLIAISNMEGEIVQTGETNKYGVVIFNDITPDNYTIEGVLYDIDLSTTSTTKKEFVVNKTLQKEVIYSDSDFILQGKSVVCNTETPLKGVSVVLKNVQQGIQKNTKTDQMGVFIFHVDQSAEYTIYGKKDSYFSQTETISTTDFNRNTTLFIKLEICMEATDCGKAITLNNIHYDLDKFFIRDDAKPVLNILVQFMNDNPEVNIELSSHTDSRGAKEYNQTLSTSRANAAVDYVVSQGISRLRISGVGYGETKLLNECTDNVQCSKEKHQENRRTEMKIICPK